MHFNFPFSYYQIIDSIRWNIKFNGLNFKNSYIIVTEHFVILWAIFKTLGVILEKKCWKSINWKNISSACLGIKKTITFFRVFFWNGLPKQFSMYKHAHNCWFDIWNGCQVVLFFWCICVFCTSGLISTCIGALIPFVCWGSMLFIVFFEAQLYFGLVNYFVSGWFHNVWPCPREDFGVEMGKDLGKRKKSSQNTW